MNTLQVFHLSYFHLKKIRPFSIFTRKYNSKREKKKTKQMYDKPKESNFPYNLKCKHLQNDLQIIQNFLQHFLQAL
jgi:hypothetical protein